MGEAKRKKDAGYIPTERKKKMLDTSRQAQFPAGSQILELIY
ncbi:MAG: hypothetical protein WCK65_15355 [Rhodospirillaceae bacterium]